MEILDEVQPDPEEVFLKVKQQNKTLRYIFICISSAGGIIFSIIEKSPNLGYMIGGVIGIVLISLLLGLIGGSLVALFPYKGLLYGQKFKRSVLIVSLIVSVLFLIIYLINLLEMSLKG